MARDFTKDLTRYMSLGTNQVGPLINGAAAISAHVWANADSFTTLAVNDNGMLQVFIGSATG